MQDLAKTVSEQLIKASKKLVTAESCTGGLIASEITRLSGSSELFERGFVTYSNEAKQELLGVSKETLDHFGAVSEETAKEMAEGALKNSRADIAISVTGIAGPSGGSDEKPVGTVCFGVCEKGKSAATSTERFNGSRHEVQDQAAKHALTIVLESLKSYS